MRDQTYQSCVNSVSSSGIIISQPNALMATITPSDVTSFGANDGTITINSPSGGSGAYEYSIDGGVTWQTLPIFSNLTAGSYNVWIRDSATPSCTVDLDGVVNTTISQPPPPPSVSVTSKSDVGCFGSNSGVITVQGLNGVAPYSYSIDGTTFGASATFNNLSAGNYTITIKDANGTTATTTATVAQPATALSASITAQSNAICFGTNTATLTATGTNGTPGYTYSIDGNNFSPNNTFNNLAAGPYTITVKDANGCLATTSATISQPTQVIATAVGVNVTLNGATSVASSGSGGTPPYTYSWTGPNSFTASTDTIKNLNPGVYTVTVTDANQCTSQIASFTVWINHAPVADNQNVVLPKDTSTPTTLTASDVDGNALSFIVLTQPTNGTLSGIAPNLVYTPNQYYYGPDSYTFKVNDGAMDSNEATVSISVTDPFKVYDGVSPNGDGKNDYWRIDGIESFPHNSVRLFDRFNNLVYETAGYSNESNNWSGQANHGLVRGSLPDGPYFYSLSLGDGTPPVSGFVVLKRD